MQGHGRRHDAVRRVRSGSAFETFESTQPTALNGVWNDWPESHDCPFELGMKHLQHIFKLMQSVEFGLESTSLRIPLLSAKTFRLNSVMLTCTWHSQPCGCLVSHVNACQVEPQHYHCAKLSLFTW